MPAGYKKWLTVDEVCVELYGKDWQNHPDIIAGRKWVRDTFYDDNGNLKKINSLGLVSSG